MKQNETESKRERKRRKKERREKRRNEGQKTSEPSVFPQRICHTPFSRLVERSWRSHALDHPPFSLLSTRRACVCDVSQRGVGYARGYIQARGTSVEGTVWRRRTAWHTDDSATNKPNKNNALSCICKWTLSFYFDGNESRGPLWGCQHLLPPLIIIMDIENGYRWRSAY